MSTTSSGRVLKKRVKKKDASGDVGSSGDAESGPTPPSTAGRTPASLKKEIRELKALIKSSSNPSALEVKLNQKENLLKRMELRKASSKLGAGSGNGGGGSGGGSGTGTGSGSGSGSTGSTPRKAGAKSALRKPVKKKMVKSGSSSSVASTASTASAVSTASTSDGKKKVLRKKKRPASSSTSASNTPRSTLGGGRSPRAVPRGRTKRPGSSSMGRTQPVQRSKSRPRLVKSDSKKKADVDAKGKRRAKTDDDMHLVTEQQLEESLMLVESLREELLEAKDSERTAQEEAERVKAELVEVEKQVREHMYAENDEMLQRIGKLQESVMDYQNKYNELRKKTRGDNAVQLRERVKDLETCVKDLQSENSRLRILISASGEGGDGGGSSPADIARIEKLEQSVLDYKAKFEASNKKNQELIRQNKARSRRDKTPQLTEQVQNLTFQLYYGQTTKDMEIDELKLQLAEARGDTEEVQRLTAKYGNKHHDRGVEEWVVDGDNTESL